MHRQIAYWLDAEIQLVVQELTGIQGCCAVQILADSAWYAEWDFEKARTLPWLDICLNHIDTARPYRLSVQVKAGMSGLQLRTAMITRPTQYSADTQSFQDHERCLVIHTKLPGP